MFLTQSTPRKNPQISTLQNFYLVDFSFRLVSAVIPTVHIISQIVWQVVSYTVHTAVLHKNYTCIVILVYCPDVFYLTLLPFLQFRLYAFQGRDCVSLFYFFILYVAIPIEKYYHVKNIFHALSASKLISVQVKGHVRKLLSLNQVVR